MNKVKILKGYDFERLEKAPVRELVPLCRKAAAEGCVLLKNDGVLPIADENISVFGRCQIDYYKSGTGSGGLVNVEYTTNIIDALESCENIRINKKLRDLYKNWVLENPYDEGTGWEQPWSQQEMPLSREVVKDARTFSKKAVIVIGRTAGESKDNREEKGSWFLSDGEEEMLNAVTEYFSEVAVLLNVGNIIDMSWVEKYNIKSVMYIWHGGQEGGNAAADVITGKISPSGKLTDTIAKNLSDYPSYANFANDEECIYQEDIYVGYRYFETFAKEKVMYPFGFGLSYTDFDIKYSFLQKNDEISVSAKVKNTGNFNGKEVIQVYFEAPQGTIGVPSRQLCGFSKTRTLEAGEEETKIITFNLSQMSSFDDRKGAYILEKGEYKIYAGTDVRNAVLVGTYIRNETEITGKTGNKLLPSRSFSRMKPQKTENGFEIAYEDVPTGRFNLEACRDIPKEIPYTGDKGIKLNDVKENRADSDTFIAQFSDEDLCDIVRGEGMSSPKVTPGTGCAFGGVTDSLLNFGIPALCGTDGPSGIRMDSGAKATSLPIGTLLACTWNLDLIYEMFIYEGIELASYKIDALLGPGMNIHRHPLNGRNFEYFSEDPFISGHIAAAIANGLSESNVTAVIKHFAANNQEQNRHRCNSIVSERALREIYLKGFEIAVKNSDVKSIMTSYNRINGIWSANNTALVTGILRDEWGFDGFVMTDWWANMNPEIGDDGTKTNMIWFVQSQNDVYMVTESAEARDDNLETALKDGKITRAELQRNAKNICRFAIETNALKRYIKGDYIKVGELIRRADELDVKFKTDSNFESVDFFADKEGMYLVMVEAQAEGDALVQSTMRICINQGPIAVTVKGGEIQKIYREVYLLKGNHRMKLELPSNITVKTLEIREDF